MQESEDSVGVEIHDEIGGAGEDAEGGLTSEDVGGVGHGVDLGAKSVPWIAALHGIGGEVGNGVDGLAADDGGRLMEE